MNAVAVMTRAPSWPGKIRLAAHLSEPRLRSLKAALLADTLAAVAAVRNVDRHIYFSPDEGRAEIAASAPDQFTLSPQRPADADDLGSRMKYVFDDLLGNRRRRAAVLVGSDAAMLSASIITGALDALRSPMDVVIGPADDGGYYLIGMRMMHAALFEAIEWGSDHVCADTLRVASAKRLSVKLAPRLYDVDTPDDLRRLQNDVAASGAAASRVREWFRGHARTTNA